MLTTKINQFNLNRPLTKIFKLFVVAKHYFPNGQFVESKSLPERYEIHFSARFDCD